MGLTETIDGSLVDPNVLRRPVLQTPNAASLDRKEDHRGP